MAFIFDYPLESMLSFNLSVVEFYLVCLDGCLDLVFDFDFESTFSLSGESPSFISSSITSLFARRPLVLLLNLVPDVGAGDFIGGLLAADGFDFKVVLSLSSKLIGGGSVYRLSMVRTSFG